MNSVNDMLRAVEAAVPSVLYLATMFLCTMVYNVPLNNELMAIDVAKPDAAKA